MFCKPKEPFLEIKSKKSFVDPKIYYNFPIYEKISFFIINKYFPLSGTKKLIKINNNELEEIISPEIFIKFFINFNSNLTQLQFLL